MFKRRLGTVGIGGSLLALGLAATAAFVENGWSLLSTAATAFAGIGVALGALCWALGGDRRLSLAAVAVGGAALCWVIGRAALAAMPAATVALLIVVLAVAALFFGKE